MASPKDTKADNIARELLKKLGPGPDIKQILKIEEKGDRPKPRD